MKMMPGHNESERALIQCRRQQSAAEIFFQGERVQDGGLSVLFAMMEPWYAAL